MYVGLKVDQIIAIHDQELAESNGLPGIKEPGYLEFIAEKPFTEVFGQEQYPGLFNKAAILMSALITSHCFFDANKRTGVLCTYVFLHINGYELNASDDDLFDKAIQVATNDYTTPALAKWLEVNSHKI